MVFTIRNLLYRKLYGVHVRSASAGALTAAMEATALGADLVPEVVPLAGP
jgi:hypothetical protein